jgi:hypothetical protein
MARRLLESIAELPKDKAVQQQTKLMGNSLTVVLKVTAGSQSRLWEVPSQMSVADVQDLVQWKCQLTGQIYCGAQPLHPSLLVGFVYLYCWRTESSMELILR